MGVFDDKKFDELDWISQATEPIDSQMNEVLAKIPDRIEIDFDKFSKLCGTYSADLSVSRIVNHLMSNHCPDINLSYQELSALYDCFKLELSSEDMAIDYEKRQIVGGHIHFIKTATTMDDKLLESILGVAGIEAFNYASLLNNRHETMSRMNEILELLGNSSEAIRGKNLTRKRRAICTRLTTIFKQNEWKIKDTELANKVGFWIKDYVVDGNLAAFSNFCRLKVMTHKGQPIYSMEEVV